jgi:phosphoserine aminotransferase
MDRKANFFAGPSTLPVPVLEELKDTIVDFHDSGLSIIETSHRSKMYDQVHQEAGLLLRELLSIPDDFHVLFLGGGATLQFAMLPMNLLADGKSCDFTMSGEWAKKAYTDAKKVGSVNVIFDGADGGYTSLPETLTTTDKAAYLHITSNETIGGVQWNRLPQSSGVPIAADMSSDIMSRPFSFDQIGVVYAGAQKNLGPAGVTVVIIKKDLVEAASDSLPAYLSYKTHAEKDSLYNTPPVFSIYALKLVLEHVKMQGGVSAAERASDEKSNLIYNEIDSSGGFFTSKVDIRNRSKMNIVFNLPEEELTKQFLTEAEAAGMLGLKGHRSVGGCRASLYNALPVEWASNLASLMKDFAARRG